MPCLREGFPVEAPQPRGKGPQQGVETSSPVIQVHCVHGNIRTGKQSILIVSSSTIDKIYEITLLTKIGMKSALFTKIVDTKFS